MSKATGLHDAARFTTFATLTAKIAKGPLVIKGKWATFPCTKLWAAANADGDIAALKAAGYKTFWVRGGQMGARIDDVGLVATLPKEAK